MIFNLAKTLIIYFVPLLLLSPIVDHIFGILDKTKTSIQILVEIFFHILVLIILWKYIHKFVKNKHKTKMDIDIPIFVQGIVLVGLQRNLIDKLNYITYKHPIRLIKII